MTGGSPIVIDTNIASDRFKSRPRLSSALLAGRTPLISFVTYAELRKWARIRDWAPHNLARLQTWLDATPLIEGDADVAAMYGELAAAHVRRGRPRPENDAWIAACCLVHDLPLMTLNVKDFADFEADNGLRLVRL